VTPLWIKKGSVTAKKAIAIQVARNDMAQGFRWVAPDICSAA